MSLAILLRRRGVVVDLVDLDPEWRALGAGLTINYKSLDAFRVVGVMDEMVEAGHIHDGLRMHDEKGNIISDVPAQRLGADFGLGAMGGILRPTLHHILSRRTVRDGTRVRLGVTIDSIRQDADGVDTVTSDGEEGRYDLVIGADGLMSKVRSLVMPDAPKPTFTGQGCWRAVFKRPPEVMTNWVYSGPGFKAGFNPISEEEMYLFILETVPPGTWRDPADWPKMMEERMAAFGGLIHEFAHDLDERHMINYRPLESVLVDPPWHVGRVQLIGDAVHATTPHVGYGAGLAVEDAVVLDDELSKGGDLDDVLTRFSDRRWERCKMVVQGSGELGQLEQNHRPITESNEVWGRIFAEIAKPI